MTLPIYHQQDNAISLGLRCWYCEVLLDPNTQAKRNSRTIDHIIPVCRGGSNKITNKVYSCSDCNQLKADLELHEFYTKVANLVINDYRYAIMIININKLQKYKRQNKRSMIRRPDKSLMHQIDKLTTRHPE